MVTRTVTIYEVPNSYVDFGISPTISATYTMQITDDDNALQGTAAADTGAPQQILVNGNPVDSYQFFYDDTILINGATQTVKTFQLTINGNVHSFVMNDAGSTIPGASVGTGFDLTNYTGYTPLNYSSLPCFTQGTLILTESGPRPIETLQPGDLVETRDNGLQPLRWIGQKHLGPRALIARPELCPILLPAGCLGDGLPSRDLMLSPQHRVLLGGWQLQMHFGLDEALAPAHALVGRNGIARLDANREVTYFHIMFDRHEIVFSNDLPSESFLVGDTIRDGMDHAQLAEILAIFPELATARGKDQPVAAAPILRNHEARIVSPVAA